MINGEVVRMVDARPELQLPVPKSQSKNLQSVEITKVRASANKDSESAQGSHRRLNLSEVARKGYDQMY
jgi:hypothetical protein